MTHFYTDEELLDQQNFFENEIYIKIINKLSIYYNHNKKNDNESGNMFNNLDENNILNINPQLIFINDNILIYKTNEIVSPEKNNIYIDHDQCKYETKTISGIYKLTIFDNNIYYSCSLLSLIHLIVDHEPNEYNILQIV